MLTAGTDVKALVASSAAVLLAVAAIFGSVALYVWRNETGEPRALARSPATAYAAARRRCAVRSSAARTTADRSAAIAAVRLPARLNDSAPPSSAATSFADATWITLRSPLP